MQFIMLDVDLINNPDLSNDEIIAYSLLCDRMKSSRTNQQFYDSKLNDFYVIYTLDQMAKDLKVSVRKVGQIFNKLVQNGFLTKKKQFSRADKLFLPKFNNIDPANRQDLQAVDAKSASPQTQKLQTNHSQENQKNQSEFNTVNTTNQANTNYSPIAKWKQSVCGKLKVHELVIDQILQYTHQNLKQAHKIMGIILNAKANIAKKNGLLNSPISRFENNSNLGTKLAVKLKHVFSYFPANLNEQQRYLMASMKTFFLEAFGISKDKMVTPEVANNESGRDFPLPDWMRSDYKSNDSEITEEEEQALKKRLADFYKN
ncbi:replication initiator protein A (plasmid) [Nicoliella spurrieriana]|uniref:Replication initiator protein A n=1 Tax=Nicoliella spurrieriana TaxID=2925830 RepID=A0A976RQV0_9LACO|nr:replication initiator protein A [Nicoliella spurrieriana]UQS86149.1 replication initiator protein A [Nicoliella spurrieriana]